MKYLLVILSALLMIAPAFANSNIACISASVLEENTTLIVGSNVTTVSEQINCKYGCTNNQCTPAATLNQWNSLILAILFSAILIAGVASESNPIIVISGCILFVFGALLGTQGILLDNVLTKNASTGGLGLAIVFGALYLVIGSVAEWRAKSREE